jgi:hypothetical protein
MDVGAMGGCVEGQDVGVGDWLLCCVVSHFLIFLRCVRVNVVGDVRSCRDVVGIW